MTHQVKDPAGAVTAVAHIAAMVQVRSVAWELPYDMGAAKKKKILHLGGADSPTYCVAFCFPT